MRSCASPQDPDVEAEAANARKPESDAGVKITDIHMNFEGFKWGECVWHSEVLCGKCCTVKRTTKRTLLCAYT